MEPCLPLQYKQWIRNKTATYRFLEKTSVSAPKVHEVMTDSTDLVHVRYITIVLVPGRLVLECLDANCGQLEKGNDPARARIRGTHEVRF